MCTSNLIVMRTCLEEVDVKTMLEMIVKTGIDILAPKKAKTIVSNKPPWRSSK